MAARTLGRGGLVGPDAAGVVDDLARAFGERDRLEHVMVDQHDEQVAAFDRVVDVDQPCAQPIISGRQDLGIGFDDADPVPEFLRQRQRDLVRRALAEIVDIGLERQAQARDPGVGLASISAPALPST